MEVRMFFGNFRVAQWTYAWCLQYVEDALFFFKVVPVIPFPENI